MGNFNLNFNLISKGDSMAVKEHGIELLADPEAKFTKLMSLDIDLSEYVKFSIFNFLLKIKRVLV